MIYLDHHATTPCHDEVVKAMLPYFSQEFGNPHAKDYALGWRANEAIDNARTIIAKAMGAKPNEIIFTSGATEANNMAIKGLAQKAKAEGRMEIVSIISEHSCVRESLYSLKAQDFDITLLPIKNDGRIDLELYKEAITEKVGLVSVMAANNEIGTIYPLQELAEIAHEKGAYFHSDAVQIFTKHPFDVKVIGCDMASISAHKLYGPKGVGALYIRHTNHTNMPLPHPVPPLLHGGGQERSMRSGTLPTPLIIGFGKAVEMEMQAMEDEGKRLGGLRDRLWQKLCDALGNQISLNGVMDSEGQERLYHNLNVNLYDIEADELFSLIPEIALSTGSACQASGHKQSHVMQALGHDPAIIMTSLRFGLGHQNSQDDIDNAASQIINAVKKLNRN